LVEAEDSNIPDENGKQESFVQS